MSLPVTCSGPKPEPLGPSNLTFLHFILRPAIFALVDWGVRRDVDPMTGVKVTTQSLREMKARGQKIASLTAYDYPMARLLDEAGVPLILVPAAVGETREEARVSAETPRQAPTQTR